MLQELCLLLLKATALYFLSINLGYGILMVLSWLKVRKFLGTPPRHPQEPAPGVSFLVPAFNEESLIVETLQTYLALPQENKEIIVINDGSHDHTLKLLQTMFGLRRDEKNIKLFRSITHPELKVLEAPHLGKAQALNFGVAVATHEIICTMDADTIPDARGVEACLASFTRDPKLIATGGVIQVLSSKVIRDNRPLLEETKRWLPKFQRIEYLRTFVCERLGWSFLGSTALISGAFCMIRKDAVLKVGGFSQDSITEDLDLIIRLRRLYRSDKNQFRILPVTTCYTQVPTSTKHLMLQRVRWQRGLIQTLSEHPSLFFHPAYGFFGMVAIPYMWLVEVLSPVLEAVACVVVPLALFKGWIPLDLVLFYLAIGLVFNLMITVMGIYLDNKFVSRKKAWSYVNSSFHTVLIHFGYKQLNSWWRLRAILKSLRKQESWGDKPREEIIHSPV